MLHNLANMLGPWTWMIIGILLLTAEIFLPGVYLIWFGLASLSLGLISLVLWDTAFWTWQLQLIIFAGLSLAYVLIARRYLKSNEHTSDQPNLNRREDSLIGRTAILNEPIAEGRGRIKLEDSWWRVEGPDAPSGTRVIVTGANAQLLRVEIVPNN